MPQSHNLAQIVFVGWLAVSSVVGAKVLAEPLRRDMDKRQGVHIQHYPSPAEWQFELFGGLAGLYTSTLIGALATMVHASFTYKKPWDPAYAHYNHPIEGVDPATVPQEFKHMYQ